MPRYLRTGLLALALLAAASAWADDPAGEPAGDPAGPDPLDVAHQAFMAAETPEARLEVVNAFLAEHPDHPDVIAVLDAGADVLIHGLDDRPGAVALVTGHLPKIGSEESVGYVKRLLVRLYSAPGYGDELTALLTELQGDAELTFVDHYEAIQAYAAAEVWDRIDEHAAAAAPMATPEAFRAAYGDRGYSDAYIEESGRNRLGLLATYTGWAAANRDDVERAFADFETAAATLRRDFFGLPGEDLYRFWGATLAREGRPAEGLEKLALAAVYGHDEEAETLARGVHAAHVGGDWDAWVWDLRLAHAPQMVGFEANDYQDAMRSFDELRGEKATLLAFWFPT